MKNWIRKEMNARKKQSRCVYMRLAWLNQYPSFQVVDEQDNEKHVKRCSKRMKRKKKRELKDETRGGKMLSLYEYPGLVVLG